MVYPPIEIINEKYGFRLVSYHEIEDSVDDNIDAKIYLKDNRVFTASFFTVKNVESLMKKWLETGECRTAHFWACDCMIVGELSWSNIEAVVEELLEKDEFFHAFEDVTLLQED